MKSTSIHAAALRYFLEVAQRGSIAGASGALGVAVSAISRQIGNLESDLDVSLFHRTARGMVLTDAGLMVQHYARRVFLDTETLQAELRGLQGLEHTTIRVACTDGFAQDYVPSVMALFRKKHPGATFTLEVCPPATASRHVREGTVDLALTFTIAPQEGIHVEYAEAAPIYAHMAKVHPLAQRKEASMKEIVAYPVILPTEPNIIRQLFDLVCGLQSLRPNVLLTSNSLDGLNAFLRYDSAVSFCGSLSVRNRLRADRQTLVAISDPEMKQRVLQVQSMAGRQLPHGARAFVQVLVDDIRKRRRLTTRIARDPTVLPAGK
jgi:DNA-binding transcriptional LysR family regulator